MASPTWVDNVGSVSAATRTSCAFSVTGVQANDILLAALYLESDGAVTAPDSTWTEYTPIPENNTAGKEQRLHLFWRRSTDTDGTHTFTFGSTWAGGLMFTIRGAATTGTPFDGIDTAVTTSNSTTCPAVELTTTTADTLLVWFNSSWDSATATPPTGFTERYDINDNITGATLAQATAGGATGTLNGTRSVSSSHCSILLAVRSVAFDGNFGFPVVGNLNAPTASNWSHEAMVGHGMRYTAVTGDRVTQVAVYGGGNGDCSVGVYTFSGGVPVTKVGEAVITIGTAAQWWTATVDWALTNGVVYVVATNYYESASYDQYYHATTTGDTSVSTTSGPGDLQTTWVQGSTAAFANSIRATVTPSGSTVPGAVNNLAGTPADTEVDLTWTAPADGGAAITDYVVQVREV